MLSKPMDVLSAYPVRKSKKQKKAFREAVIAYVSSLGYSCNVEKGSGGANNIIIGDPKCAKYLITAHYDTPAGMLFPNFITPCNWFIFLLYQIAIVGGFVIIAFLIGLLAGLLLHSPQAAGAAAAIVYWAMLFLLMFGPANQNNANDNTSGVVTVLEIAGSLPENARSKVCFVLFDLEEAGLVGSAAYKKLHKEECANQEVFNMDCVGDGDEIVFFPNKKFKQDAAKMNALRVLCGQYGTKSIAIREKGFSYYPSDQKNFNFGVGIAAFQRGKHIGLYCSRIHTGNDTVLETTNVNVLRAALISYIAR